MYVCICLYVCIDDVDVDILEQRVCVYVCIYVYICMYRCLFVCVCVALLRIENGADDDVDVDIIEQQVCVYVCICVCVCVCVFVCVYRCLCKCVHVGEGDDAVCTCMRAFMCNLCA